MGKTKQQTLLGYFSQGLQPKKASNHDAIKNDIVPVSTPATKKTPSRKVTDSDMSSPLASQASRLNNDVSNYSATTQASSNGFFTPQSMATTRISRVSIEEDSQQKKRSKGRDRGDDNSTSDASYSDGSDEDVLPAKSTTVFFVFIYIYIHI